MVQTSLFLFHINITLVRYYEMKYIGFSLPKRVRKSVVSLWLAYFEDVAVKVNLFCYL